MQNILRKSLSVAFLFISLGFFGVNQTFACNNTFDCAISNYVFSWQDWGCDYFDCDEDWSGFIEYQDVDFGVGVGYNGRNFDVYGYYDPYYSDYYTDDYYYDYGNFDPYYYDSYNYADSFLGYNDYNYEYYEEYYYCEEYVCYENYPSYQ